MHRLGTAELNGELGLSKSPKEGVKWLKRSTEHATAEFSHALHELALLHERGIDNVLFVDYEYSTELLAQAAELGYAASAYRLGECYEYGKMGCLQDPALSIHYYVVRASELCLILNECSFSSCRTLRLSKTIVMHVSH
jgi:TPR repeat protein